MSLIFLCGLLITILIYFIMAQGFNFISGYTGTMSFAQGGIAALGAYSTLIFTVTLKINFWIALPLSGIVAAITAILIGAVSIRLKGMYFAVLTFGFGEVVRIVIRNLESLTGGVYGSGAIGRIPSPVFFGITLGTKPKFLILVFVLAVISLVLMRNIIKSPIGHAYKAIGEDENAAAAVGVDITFYKLHCFAIGSFFTGIGGSLLGVYFSYISPDQFSFELLTLLLTIFIVGGPGNMLGISIATVLVALVPTFLAKVPTLNGIIYGALLIIAIYLRFKNINYQRLFSIFKSKSALTKGEGVNASVKNSA